MKTLDPNSRSSLDMQGLDWQDLCWRPLYIASYQIIKLRTSWFQRRFLKVFPIISLGELYVAMAARVPTQSAQKPYAALPPTAASDDAFHEI